MMHSRLSEPSLPREHYFDRPFAVRDANGRPFACLNKERNQFVEASQSKDPETHAGFVQAQREQRHTSDGFRSLSETNSRIRDNDIPAMDSIFQRPSLKRKYSADSRSMRMIKRPRTASETQLDAPVTIVRELLPRLDDRVAKVLIKTAHSTGLNPLKCANGTPYSVQLNPLHGVDNDAPALESLPSHCESSEKGEQLHAIYPALKLKKLHDRDSPVFRQDEDAALYPVQDPKSRAVDQLTVPFESSDSNSIAAAQGSRRDLYSSATLSRADGRPSEGEPFVQTVTTETGNCDAKSSELLFSCDDAEPIRVFETSPVYGAEPLLDNSNVGNFDANPSDTLSANKSPQCPSSYEQGQEQRSFDNHHFVQQVKAVLRNQSKWKTANVGRRQARRIGHLLELSKPPDTSEVLFLSNEDAKKQLHSGNFFSGPIITENQQPLPLQTTAQFLNEYYDETANVWIQDPAVLLARNVPHAREITIRQLKQRFSRPSPKGKIPWNCLEMATHVEDGLRPSFLNNEDCRLLTKLKLPSSGDSASRRGFEPGWKEVEKWALLAQGGALTEPHQDSHGYSTYITINQGTMGFGWLSNPTTEERLAWREKPATYIGGRWRHVVLRPGHTIFFPSGTVHFVFRLASLGDTLAFGGHVLRCSQIVRWIETMLEEKAGPDITNEEMTVSAPAYLERVEKFVNQAQKTGHVERWGGAEAIEKFLRLKEKFMNDRPFS